MGSKRNVDMSATTDNVKIVATDSTTTTTEEMAATETATTKKVRGTGGRSKKYQAVRSQVDKTRTYDAYAAIELVKRLSYSKFVGTISAHGVLRETGARLEITFPHSTGRTVRVAVASDEVLKQIEEGKIEFDVLLSTPDFMKQLAKHARVLGPRGLMPNPKNGTLTENPEKRKKELEAGKTLVESEKKAPLVHVAIGKTDMDTKDVVENLQTLTKHLKGKLVKLSVAASMSPGVRVEIA